MSLNDSRMNTLRDKLEQAPAPAAPVEAPAEAEKPETGDSETADPASTGRKLNK